MYIRSNTKILTQTVARGLLSQRMMLQFKKGVGITKRIEHSEGNEIGSLLT